MLAGDLRLIQIVDAKLAAAAHRSGSWLKCRPGCAQCCLDDFAITPLDAQRLQDGFAQLRAGDPARADRVAQRVRAVAARGGVLAEDEACPALDPETQTCDLYSARPITCRTFGPPVRCESGELGVCELCFDGATEAEIAACEVEFDPDGLEPALLEDLAKAGFRGDTTVTGALSRLLS